jgi:thioesterase domain-containing protein
MSQLVPERISARSLTAFLHDQIPLARAMQLKVAEAGDERVVLHAPLAPNRNHLGTAFGGSLQVLPTLACYSALWLTLREAGYDGHVVVRRSSATFHEPLAGELRAVCVRPSAAAVAPFLATLRRHKKARLDLHAEVAGDTPDKPAVKFSGTFVAVV